MKVPSKKHSNNGWQVAVFLHCCALLLQHTGNIQIRCLFAKGLIELHQSHLISHKIGSPY